MTNPSAAVATTVSKIYGSGDSEVRALDDVSVQFEKGKFTAIMGPSGSGKSTLMHCMAGLDALTSGNVSVGGTELAGLSDKALTGLRREQIGFIFQAFAPSWPASATRHSLVYAANKSGLSFRRSISFQHWMPKKTYCFRFHSVDKKVMLHGSIKLLTPLACAIASTTGRANFRVGSNNELQ